MTIKEAFETYDWWSAPATPAQKSNAISYFETNFPNDRIKYHEADADWITFKPHDWTLHVGLAHEPQIESSLLVPTFQRLSEGVQKLATFRHVLPVQGKGSVGYRHVSLFVFNDRIYLPYNGWLSVSDWANVVGIALPTNEEEL